MNRLFLILLSIGLSILPAMAMDHSAAKTEDPVLFLHNLFRNKQLKREEVNGQYSNNGEACRHFVEQYWADIEYSANELKRNNNNLAFEDLENVYAALWLAEKCSIDIKNNARAQTAHRLLGEIVISNRDSLESMLVPRALRSSEPLVAEQALSALNLLETYMGSNADVMGFIRENRPRLKEKARQIAPIGKGIIDLFTAGALNMDTSDRLWQTDKDRIVVSKETQDRLCRQFCASHKAFIIDAAEGLPKDPAFHKLQNVFAALRYLHGCEALLSGAVLRGEEMSDAQKTGTQLVERFRAIVKKEVDKTQTSTAANYILFAGIEACDIFHFFGNDAEKIMYRKTGDELKERLAKIEKPKKDDSSMPKPVEKKYTSVKSRSSNITIKKLVIGGFSLAALAAASWFAYDRYGKKKGPGAPQPQPRS